MGLSFVAIDCTQGVRDATGERLLNKN